MAYYNTTNESGKSLKENTKKTISQNDKILMYFCKNRSREISPSQVHSVIFDNSTPITSIRRSITNLTNDGLLTKTKTKRVGNYGNSEHCWIKK